MLVITRTDGEKFRIGDDIVITVNTTSNTGKVKFGITAPDDVRILREELDDDEDYESEQLENSVAFS